MNKKIEVHCSSLPRGFRCPASLAGKDASYRDESEASRVGTAAHTLFARMATTGDVSTKHIIAEAHRLGVDADELKFVYYQGLSLFGELPIKIDATEVNGELVFDEFILTGTADALGMDMHGVPHVIDWKTGRKVDDHRLQLIAYAAIHYGGHDMVRIITVYPRLGSYHVHEVLRDDMHALLDELTIIVGEEKEKFVPGEQCYFCPRRSQCPARDSYLADSATQIRTLITSDDGTGTLPVQALASLYPQSKLLSKALEDYEKALRTAVEASGEAGVPVPGGRLLMRQEERGTCEYDLVSLGQWCDPLDLHPTVSMSDLNDAVKKRCKSEKLPIGETIEQAKEALTKSGTIVNKPIKKMVFEKGEANG